MHDYLLSAEWIRFAFVLGVAVSMVMYEKRHLTTGSIVVPGYIAVFIIHPLVILATFINAFITYAFVNLFLRRYFLLYGRTKFTILAVTSTTIQFGMLRITPSGQWLWERDIPLFIGVGYIVPALIAHDMARQGVWKTTKSVLMAGCIVATPIAAALILDLPGVNDLSPVSGFGNIAISLEWLPFAVALSVGASWAVAHNYNLRSGGFVGAAFTGMFMADPWQVVVALTIALATWLIVAKVLMNHMILFGRRKFSSMLLVSSAIAWSGLWVGDRFLDANWQEHLGVGSLALTPLLLPGLIANDAQRTSPLRVMIGLVLAGSFSVTATWWVQSGVIGEPLHPGWKLVATVTFCIMFAKQFSGMVLLTGSRLLAAPKTVIAFVRSIPSQTPAAPGLALAHATADTGTEAGAWDTPWDAWARRHPAFAADAEEWVTAQIARFSKRPVGDTASSSTGYIDDVTTSVLETALEEQRGMRRVPRRPAERHQISETSDAATREAQPAASDVSGATDPTTPLEQPLIDF
jgi:poly-gamma-glutamate biosynthesis protein PgsC/CapC